MNLKPIKANMNKVETWLPIFSGFYSTIWESEGDEDQELENINDERKENKLPPITWDDVEWDYEGYQKQVSEGITRHISGELEKLGMVSGYEFQKLSSPREYNFANDSIEVAFLLSDENKMNILKYLIENKSAFVEYIKDRYTSYDGFFSSYSNDAIEWLVDSELLIHQHKLGAVLNFILLNENGKDYEISIYEDLRGNGCFLTAINYSELIKDK